MEIKVHTEPFHYIEIDGMYNKEQLSNMLDECKFYEKQGFLQSASKTGSAITNGELLKRNKGLFLDNFYSREKSKLQKHILTIYDVLFNNKNVDLSVSWLFKNFRPNCDRTLISYYENEDYYDSHFDTCSFTAITWIFEEPKAFKGGSLKFTNFDVKIPCKNNYTVVFPSQVDHEVTELMMDEKDMGKGKGRFAISQFMHISPPQ